METPVRSFSFSGPQIYRERPAKRRHWHLHRADLYAGTRIQAAPQTACKGDDMSRQFVLSQILLQRSCLQPIAREFCKTRIFNAKPQRNQNNAGQM